MKKFKLEIFEKDYPYDEITNLLHLSYKDRLDNGEQFLAATQSVEITKSRLEGCSCLVAYNDDNEIIATVTYKTITKTPYESRKWYEDDNMVYIEQMAVHPYYRKSGVLLQLKKRMEDLECVKNADSLISDTSELALDLVKGYTAMGFQIVDVVSWGTTNYYSLVLRKAINGKRYDEKYVKRKVFFSNLRCRLVYNRHGEKRLKKNCIR